MKGKRFGRILGAISLVTITISAILALWTARAEAFAHYRPEYEQKDLLPILQKDILTEEDYILLFSQTGLARAGIDDLWAAGRQEKLFYLQHRYFADTEIECLHNDLFIRSERLINEKSIFSAEELKPNVAAISPVGELKRNVYIPVKKLKPYAIFPADESEPYTAFPANELEPCASSPVNKLPTYAAFSASVLEQNAVFSARKLKPNTTFRVKALELNTSFLADESESCAALPVDELEPEPYAAFSASVSEPYAAFPTVQPGDILITFSGHVFGWRSGHAAIVIDAEKRLTLEAITIGCDSRICSLADWEEYPSVALLRLKNAPRQEREQIAAYAREHLQGLPYSLTALTIYDNSIDASETPPSLTGTQCAHLVWYAYRGFGYDLDSDGGLVVTPDDLYHSDLLELVQIYGIPPNY